jgi:hypothetical protein
LKKFLFEHGRLQSAVNEPRHVWLLDAETHEKCVEVLETPDTHEPASLLGLRALVDYGLTLSHTGQHRFANPPRYF